MEPFLPGIADDFDDYLAKMAQPGVWGGGLLLWWCCKCVMNVVAISKEQHINGRGRVARGSSDLSS
jgi:hypothetical protein